jgi:quinol monooxygenase YgiN
MWAQLIKARLKPGKEDQLERLSQQFQAAEQPGSGLVRSATMRDQNNPTTVYMMIVVESEEKARAREQDPRREEGLAVARATMAEIFEGPFEFVDLEVVADVVT